MYKGELSQLKIYQNVRKKDLTTQNENKCTKATTIVPDQPK